MFKLRAANGDTRIKPGRVHNIDRAGGLISLAHGHGAPEMSARDVKYLDGTVFAYLKKIKCS